MSVFKDRRMPMGKASMDFIMRHVKQITRTWPQEFMDANEMVAFIASKMRKGRRTGLELLRMIDDPGMVSMVHEKAARYLSAYDNVILTQGQRDVIIVSLCLTVLEKYDGGLWEHVAAQYPGFFDVFGRRAGEEIIKSLAQEYALDGESTREFLMRQAIVPVSHLAEYLAMAQKIYVNELGMALGGNLEGICRSFGKDRDEALFLANAIRYVDGKAHGRNVYHCGEETFDRLDVGYVEPSQDQDAWKAFLWQENGEMHMHIPYVWLGGNIDMACVTVEISGKDAGKPAYTAFANGYRLAQRDCLLAQGEIPGYRVKCGGKVVFDYSKYYSHGNVALDENGRQVDPAKFEGKAFINGVAKEISRFDIVEGTHGDIVFAPMDVPEFTGEAYGDTFVWAQGERHPLYRIVKSMRFCHASFASLAMEIDGETYSLDGYIVAKGKSAVVYDIELPMLREGMSTVRVYEAEGHRLVFERRLFIDGSYAFVSIVEDDHIAMHVKGIFTKDRHVKSSMKEIHPCAVFFELDGIEDSLVLIGHSDIPCFRVNHGRWHLFSDALGDAHGRLYFTGFACDQAFCGQEQLTMREGYVRLQGADDIVFMRNGEHAMTLRRKKQ